MKKHLTLISLLFLPLLASCNQSNIEMPKSPFDDSYQRIGMTGEYVIKNGLTQEEYNGIKASITVNPETRDVDVASYHIEQEDRDLKYAYFGDESSSISQCTMTSNNQDLTRYKNNVFINNNVTDKQVQVKNGGIVKTKSTLMDYTFDTNYLNLPKENNKYARRLSTKNNDDPEEVTEPTPETSYDSQDPNQVYDIFALKPFTGHIAHHFTDDFKLLGDNAVYGKTEDGKYIIKEGHSNYQDFQTTMGRSYKAQDNYFYEGVLENYQDQGKTKYHFTHFRFYHELLILSKACDGTGVPILYLDHPVLIEFNETIYSNITYKPVTSLDNYTGEIPPKTDI
ncbi:MAG: hypothetical protein MJ208_04230 [Bacilli bacterium]|nr:hypothetical protein [Bacilli bacterium]